MATAIRNPKDFWTGVMYVVFGGLGWYLARDFGMGTATRMGAGYFPTVLSVLLVVFGAIAIVRAFLTPGGPIGAFAWKAMLLVVGGTVAFGLLVRTAGLVIALLVLVLLSAAASAKFRFEVKAALGLLALVVFCALVFVKGLGVPMPLVGSWFGG